jgi:hypothetical protein
MPDPRVDALAGVVTRVEGAACWLARAAVRAAVAGAGGALVLWWALAGDRVDDWWRGTTGSLLVLALTMVPAAWLLNARNALLDLVALPDTLRGVATRRSGPVRRPDGGLLGSVRSVWAVLRDYGDVAGSWGTVAQLAVPSFWLLTLVALAAVPVLVVLAGVAALVQLA